MASQRATHLTILAAAGVLAALPATFARAGAVTATASARVTILASAPPSIRQEVPWRAPRNGGPSEPTSSTSFAVVEGVLRVIVSYN